uniref:Fanconi anemia core complex-associated protein 24 isoform X2 n=1 Tax=Tursiops truncatus TaxID=9739 RepID=A0A2U4BTM4_TURTR|nr:Fanconi anemia core complex-associated protein 24 isoform X2 [Tursiops truncatus]
MEGNTLDGTGPMHVPFGHIVANEKWRGSQLAQGMQGKIKLVFEDGLTPVDFYLSSRSCILYITEADLVAGNGYRKRLVRVRNVEEQTKEPSKNPLLRKKRALISEPALLRTVQQIPGVGKVKAPLLLQRFPSIQQLSNASIQELEPVVGQSVAQHIYAFFTQSRNTPHTLVRTLLSSLHVSWISAHTNRYRSTSFPLKTVQGPVMRILNFSNFLNVK